MSIQSSYAQEVNRKVDMVKVRELQNNPAFDYGKAPTNEVSDNFFSKIFGWILQKVAELFAHIAQPDSPSQTILIIILASIAIFALIKILELDKNFGLYKNKKNNSHLKEGEIIEDIRSIDFEVNIKKAYENKNYREVIRNYYLFTLNKLDEKGIIKWKKGKTNNEYLYEISEGNLKRNFSALNHYFEYAIYGEFDVSENLAKTSEGLHHKINQSI